MMNDIRARYIQDEREDARKEGIKEGEIKGEIKGKIEGKMEERKQVITNMLKETDDINFIHKMTNRRHKFYSQNDQIPTLRNN